jgi:hypothetical protein
VVLLSLRVNAELIFLKSIFSLIMDHAIETYSFFWEYVVVFHWWCDVLIAELAPKFHVALLVALHASHAVLPYINIKISSHYHQSSTITQASKRRYQN